MCKYVCMAATFEQVNERLLGGVFPAAAQHRVLEDVREPTRVSRRRAECDAEDFILIRCNNAKHLSTRFDVSIHGCLHAVLIDHCLLHDRVCRMSY